MKPERKFRALLGAALFASLAAFASAGAASAQGDEELIKQGKRVYNKCKACHALDKEQNKVGPHLVGIMGRPAAAVEGFKYSEALKNSGIVWNDEEFLAYVEKPKDFIPGGKMAFAGLKKESQRLALLAYVKSKMPDAQ